MTFDLQRYLQKLKINVDKPARLFNRWAVIPAASEVFESAFYLIAILNDQEYEQSGLIEYCDWSSGIARDISGQEYVLGTIDAGYKNFLEKHGASLLEIIPENLLKNCDAGVDKAV